MYRVKDTAGNEIKGLNKLNPRAGLLVVSELDKKQIQERIRQENVIKHEQEIEEMRDKINNIESKLDLILIHLASESNHNNNTNRKQND